MAVMFLVGTAAVAAYLVAIANIPGEVTALRAPFQGNPVTMMAAMMLLVVAVGTALDFVPTLLILTPVLMPLAKAAGIHPVCFGVLFVHEQRHRPHHPAGRLVLNMVSAVGRVRLTPSPSGRVAVPAGTDSGAGARLLLIAPERGTPLTCPPGEIVPAHRLALA